MKVDIMFAFLFDRRFTNKKKREKNKEMVNTEESNKFWMQHYSKIFVPKYHYIFLGFLLSTFAFIPLALATIQA